MPMDGRYITRSQGRRCEYAYMDVGKGREQERKLCPWMGRMTQGAMDGGASMRLGTCIPQELMNTI